MERFGFKIDGENEGNKIQESKSTFKRVGRSKSQISIPIHVYEATYLDVILTRLPFLMLNIMYQAAP